MQVRGIISVPLKVINFKPSFLLLGSILSSRGPLQRVILFVVNAKAGACVLHTGTSHGRFASAAL